MVSVFIASFIDKTLGFERLCELTSMKVLYSGVVSRVLASQRDDIWVEEDLMMLRSQNDKLKRVAGRVLSSQCPIRLYALNSQLLDHLVEYLERFGCIFPTDAWWNREMR